MQASHSVLLMNCKKCVEIFISIGGHILSPSVSLLLIERYLGS